MVDDHLPFCKFAILSASPTHIVADGTQHNLNCYNIIKFGSKPFSKPASEYFSRSTEPAVTLTFGLIPSKCNGHLGAVLVKI